MLHLHRSDYRVMPWKNGGGSTTEIAMEPEGSSLSDPFLWRVSSARVEASGPFSCFPGYVRSLVLLEGSGLLLDIKGKARQRLKSIRQPVVFSGDDTVNATLIQGPCVDFGVISDPSRVRAVMQVLALGAEATALTLAPAALLFAPRGKVHVDPLDIELEPQDSLYFKGASGAFRESAMLGLRASAQATPLVVVLFWPIATPAQEVGDVHG